MLICRPKREKGSAAFKFEGVWKDFVKRCDDKSKLLEDIENLKEYCPGIENSFIGQYARGESSYNPKEMTFEDFLIAIVDKQIENFENTIRNDDSGDFGLAFDGGSMNDEDGLSNENIALDMDNIRDSQQYQIQDEEIPNDINNILDNNLGYPTQGSQESQESIESDEFHTCDENDNSVQSSESNYPYSNVL